MYSTSPYIVDVMFRLAGGAIEIKWVDQDVSGAGKRVALIKHSTVQATAPVASLHAQVNQAAFDSDAVPTRDAYESKHAPAASQVEVYETLLNKDLADTAQNYVSDKDCSVVDRALFDELRTWCTAHLGKKNVLDVRHACVAHVDAEAAVNYYVTNIAVETVSRATLLELVATFRARLLDVVLDFRAKRLQLVWIEAGMENMFGWRVEDMARKRAVVADKEEGWFGKVRRLSKRLAGRAHPYK